MVTALPCSKEMPRCPAQGERNSLEGCGTSEEVWGYIQNPQNKVLPLVELRTIGDSKPTSEALSLKAH